MSGICGALWLDGRPADPGALEAMLGGLATRGPDGSARAIEGSLALGHALLATTPEAAVEPMPWRHAATGCIITADARLDNREDLLASLGLDQRGRVIGDGELIVHAYLKWGRDCPAHLLGDLAFAIWDPRHQRLFAARDKVGMRQVLYHHQPGKLLAFATDAAALLNHRDVPRRINEARIGDFLENFEEIDFVSTFYHDIYRLPRAHTLTLERGELQIVRYWQLEPPGIVTRRSDAEYDEAFREVFTAAVAARLRSPDPVGSMVSGGIDSGAVTAIAARLLKAQGAPPLTTFSAIAPEPDCIETNAIRAAWQMAHLDPRWVCLSQPERFVDEVARLTRASASPFDAHMAMIRALYVEAQRSGVKVVLDGVAGDTTIPDVNLVRYHMGRRELLAAWRAAKADDRFWNGESPAHKAFMAAARQALLPQSLKTAYRRLVPRRAAAAEAGAGVLEPEFARRINMAARRLQVRKLRQHEGDCSPQSIAFQMLHPYLVIGRERYDRVASDCGIEPRDPFMDPRVMEFCLTLPVSQFKQHGWPKHLLRRAMGGLVPDEIRWRRGRVHLGWRYSEVCNWAAANLPIEGDGCCIAPKVESFANIRYLSQVDKAEDRQTKLDFAASLQYLQWWLGTQTTAEKLVGG